MITIHVGSSDRSIDDADPNWINQQINRRRDDQENVCVRIIINEPGINVTLQTQGCESSTRGSSRPLTLEEKDIFDLWSKLAWIKRTSLGEKLSRF